MKILSPILVLVVMLGAAACGSDDSGPTATPEPLTYENATSCALLMDAYIPVLQDMLDGTKDLTEDVLVPGAQPEFLAALQDDLDRFDRRAADLGCRADELDALFIEKSVVLTAEGPVGEWALEALLGSVQ